jgi:hypothetical protein
MEALPMLQAHVDLVEAQLVLPAQTGPWLGMIFVKLEGLRVVNAMRAREQRAVNAKLVKRLEGVIVRTEVLHLKNARKALPHSDLLLQCYLLDLKETMNALFRFSMRRKTVGTIRFG